MERIIDGILRFRKLSRPATLEQVANLIKMNKPSAIFISCIDSRVFPSHFTDSFVGEMFVSRNAGNFVPHPNETAKDAIICSTEHAALELACCRNSVNNVIICGHSDCETMHLLLKLGKSVNTLKAVWPSPLEHWISQRGAASLESFLNAPHSISLPLSASNDENLLEIAIDAERKLSPVDRLSQINVLHQMVNTQLQPILADKIGLGSLRVHGMWYNIASADVYLFSRLQRRLVLIDEHSSQHLMDEYCNTPSD